MIGQTVSHYRIIEKLGGGGMGVVYRAEDTKLGRSVALKFLPEDLSSDPQAVERFQREARAASALNHPHICTIYDIDAHEGRPFIAMEVLDGDTLKHRLSSRPLEISEILDISVQIAEALEAAHARGIIHRDIKPANIFVTERGQAKILDFGLAKLLEKRRVGEAAGVSSAMATVAGGEEFLTSPGSTLGTVAYMSPEQARGESVDARSDLFSFGVVLYEMTTGRQAFPGNTSAVIFEAILNRPPTAPARFNPNLSPDFQAVLTRLLEKDRNRRFQSASQLVSELRRIKRELDSGRTTAAPVSAEKSVAVLYFENLSGDKEDEYFRDGMTEDIITELSSVRQLRVFPRTAVLAYRDKPSPGPAIGQELNASYVLGGSLRRSGDRLRITAQLIETSSGHSVWAKRYDRQMEDVFAIQDEIAQSIAAALKVMLSESEKQAIAKAPTADVRAYDFYLRGQQFFYRFHRKGYDFARKMFSNAIEIDPRYSRAYAGVANCHSYLYMYWDATEDNLRAAENASLMALEIDPDLAEGHVARGLAVSLNKKFDEAQKEFETAIRLDPGNFDAYYFYARACFQQGNLELAAHLFEKASEVNPADYQAPAMLGMVFDGQGKKVDSRAANGRAYRAAQKHLELHPDDARALYLGAAALCHLGERERSLEWARMALAIDPDDAGILYNVACVYSIQSKIEEAIDCLEKAMVRGFWYKRWAQNDPDLNALRSHPRFIALMERS